MKTVNELASSFVGSNKRGNKYFVTVGYGWYFPKNSDDDTEFKQVKDSLKSVTIVLPDLESAQMVFNAIQLDVHATKLTGESIGQVTIEDKSGTIKEKYITEGSNGKFYKTQY